MITAVVKAPIEYTKSVRAGARLGGGGGEGGLSSTKNLLMIEKLATFAIFKNNNASTGYICNA
jgi:hypothetical protein